MTKAAQESETVNEDKSATSEPTNDKGLAEKLQEGLQTYGSVAVLT